MGFYDDMADMVRDILQPDSGGGLGQGVFTLMHITPGSPNPAAPWEPVTPVTQMASVRGAVRGISKELIGVEVGGTVLLATDRVALCEVPPIDCSPGDTLTVDGVTMTILAVEKIPAAGVTSAVKFFIRG